MAEEPLDVAFTSPEDWRYISEGGATIVLSYHGAYHANFTGMVLRLRKAKRITSGLDNPVSDGQDNYSFGADFPSQKSSLEGQTRDFLLAKAFQDQVIAKYVSSEYLLQLRLVSTDENWLWRLSRTLESLRPPERREIDVIACDQQRAFLATDLVGKEGLVIEIKPKWGYLPNGLYLSPSSKNIKTRHCRFCMHSYYRAQQKQEEKLWKTKKRYCPLDLFSGDSRRVEKAISALWDSWIVTSGNTNNLKIFFDGQVLKPDDENAMDHFARRIRTSLSLSDLKRKFVASFTPLVLEHRELFGTISNLQRAFDPLDMEGLQKLWGSLRGNNVALGRNFPEPSIEDWNQFTSAYPPTNLSGLPTATSKGEAGLYDLCLAQLLSGTFKDCSIIFRPDSGLEKASAHIIDLEPKSVIKLSKWVELDRTIVDAFKSADVDNNCKCIDNSILST